MKHHLEPPRFLSPAQLTQLREYERLMLEYNPSLGLVSERDVGRIWERHIVDSLRGWSCVDPTAKVLFDVGSGAGLPGIPLAVGLPHVETVLIEPKARRGAFLELVVERLGLENVRVLVRGAEGVRETADVCTARAFADPMRTWRIASRLLRGGGGVLYYAGRSWDASSELALFEAGVEVEVCDEPRSEWQGPVLALRPATRDPRG